MQTQLLTARTEVLAARIEVLAALRQWPVVERRAGAAMASVTVPLSRVCLGRCQMVSTVRGAAAFLPEVDGFSTAELPLYDVSASRRQRSVSTVALAPAQAAPGACGPRS